MSISLRKIFKRFKFSQQPIKGEAKEIITATLEKPRILTRYIILERYKYSVDGKFGCFSEWDIGYLRNTRRIYLDKTTAEHAMMQMSSHGYGKSWILEHKVVPIQITIN